MSKIRSLALTVVAAALLVAANASVVLAGIRNP